MSIVFPYTSNEQFQYEIKKQFHVQYNKKKD